MQVVIKVNDAALRAKLGKLNQQAILKQAGEDTTQFLRTYHTRFRNNWRGDNYMAGPRSGMFWQRVVAGWQDPTVSGNTVTLTNTFGLLNWKVKGGTISPVTKTMLTIPLVGEAKGLTVEEYAISEGIKLFRVGKTLARKEGKGIKPIYALVSSVTQGPWPGAMPDNSQLQSVFARSVKKQIIASINGN